MNFNFNSLANTSFSNDSKQYLRPYDIYEVNLKKIEKTELNGKDGTVYPVVSLEFVGVGEAKGIFNQNIFIPTKDEDFQRNENPSSHKLMPSRFDQFQYTLMQIVEAINPEGAQKIKDNAAKITTIDQFVGLVTKALAKNESKNVFLKLVGQNNGGTVYSRLPNACLIDKDGEPAPLNFINSDSSKLRFSPYEINQMKAMENAKPTKMDSVDDSDNSDEFDLDDIDEL